MRKNRLISNLVAIIFLTALSPKIGFEMFYHNWQHSKASGTSLPVSSPSLGSANCNCIDDFSMPFMEASIEAIAAPKIYPSLFISHSIKFCSSFYQCFHALRAPPVFVA
jgi:hypothetical protein